ncbi:MAG: hypothetical protein U0641_08125 [Anaerolineae bacterium]
MTRRNIFVGLLLIALALGSAACKSVADKVSDVTGGGKTVTVSIVYGSEKQEWLEPLISSTTCEGERKTPDGATIVVQGTPRFGGGGGCDCGWFRCSPPSGSASSICSRGERGWRKTKTTNLVEGTPRTLCSARW